MMPCRTLKYAVCSPPAAGGSGLSALLKYTTSATPAPHSNCQAGSSGAECHSYTTQLTKALLSAFKRLQLCHLHMSTSLRPCIGAGQAVTAYSGRWEDLQLEHQACSAPMSSALIVWGVYRKLVLGSMSSSAG